MLDFRLEPGSVDSKSAFLIPADGTTKGRILCPETPASSPLVGGCSIYQLICSTDDAANTITLWEGVLLDTVASGTGTGGWGSTQSITGTNSINRGATGSFITNGFKVGADLLLTGTSDPANENILSTITAVTTTAITAAGLTNETLPNGAKLYQLSRLMTRPVVANAGFNSTTPPTSLLGTPSDDAEVLRRIDLSATGILVVAVGTTVNSAKRYQVTAKRTLY
jgi:hypothetical protein